MLLWPAAGDALASGSAGTDPSSNFVVGALPSACQSDPSGAVCIDASVGYLNQARASLGQPPYGVPADFASLTPPQQALVLTNSDRSLYGLPPIGGETTALDQDAAAGVANDTDPQPSSADWYEYTSNAAWGQANMVLAYAGWMYDDGPGSDNLDCTALDPSGCWAHRHDILWQFGSGPLAMGAASGTDAGGEPSYAMLLLEGSPDYSPAYSFTWAPAGQEPASSDVSVPSPLTSGTADPPQAVPAAVAPRARVRIESLRVRRHRVTAALAGPGFSVLRCSLVLRGRRLRSKPCRRGVSFARLPAGRYRLRISSSAGVVSRRVVVR